MDIALFNMAGSNRRNKVWAETMVNLEARKLVNKANTLAAFHLKDSLTRINFAQEIQGVVEQQFAIARKAKSDEECMLCLSNLRAEVKNLEEQERMLRMKTAKLYAKVEFAWENNKIVGYVISAVKVVVSGMAIFGGGVLIATGNPIGILAGAILITDGINQISKEAINLSKFSDSKSEGIIADQAMEIAKFMGFKPESGLAVYNSISLAASVYSIVGLSRRPEAWRLFRYLPGDFYRKVNTMSTPKLTMKIAGYGVKAKVIFDLINTDNN
ncbi:DUF4225 domain-containing protein [Salmonella enterica]|nr:DUF4225 domain-containing protein [Salmonella enterica]